MKRLLVNFITASRVILGLLFLYYVLVDLNTVNLTIIFIITAFSDMLDGRLARKYGLATDDGAKFDVICDFAFIILSTLALVLIDLIPAWFLLVIILKLVEFFKTSDKKLNYDGFGHTVALMFYVFPLTAIFIGSKMIVLILAIFITICAVISSILRIMAIK